MSNNRQKGKRGERWFATRLREVFPNVKRNADNQSQEGGLDLKETGVFNFEVKFGKAYKSKKIRNMIDQVEMEGKGRGWDCVLVKPDREDAYAVIPFEDFMEILGALRNEGVI